MIGDQDQSVEKVEERMKRKRKSIPGNPIALPSVSST